MLRIAIVLGAILLAACTDDSTGASASWTELPGAPRAVTSLSFDSSGVPVVVGGSATFGDYYLQRPRAEDGLWGRAEGVPLGSFGDRVFRVDGTLYAILDLHLLRLDDEAAFTWSMLDNPTTDEGNPVQLLGLSADDVVYATSGRQVTPGVFRNVLLSWSPGQIDWTLVPGSEDVLDYYAAVVEPGGRITFSTADGLYRGDVSGVTRVLDCMAPEYLYCEAQISSLTVDAAGELSFLVCPFVTDQRAIFRLPTDGGEVRKVASISGEFPYCHGLQALPDGTVFLVSAVDNTIGSDTALFRLPAGGSSLAEVAGGLDGSYGHVVRDSSTVFRFGDAGFVTGVFQRRF